MKCLKFSHKFQVIRALNARKINKMLCKTVFQLLAVKAVKLSAQGLQQEFLRGEEASIISRRIKCLLKSSH